MNESFKLALLIGGLLYGAAALQWWIRSRRERKAREEQRNSTVLHKVGLLKPGETVEEARRRNGRTRDLDQN